MKADFGYITDLHLKVGEKPPKWFAGPDFLSDQLNRLEVFFTRCLELNCSHIFFGGDIFDSYNGCTPQLFNDLVSLFKDYQHRGLNFQFVIGNHDLYGRVMVGYWDSWISHLIKSTNSQIYDFYFQWFGKEAIMVDYGHWDSDLEREIRGSNLMPKSTETGKLAFIHTAIGPEEKEYCKSIHDFEPGNSHRLIAFGDQHEGWKPFKKNGTWLVNPGSFSLMKVDELDRTPKMGFYNIGTDSYWEEDLPKPPIRDFNHSKIKKYVSKVQEYKIVPPIPHIDLIEKVAGEKKYSKESKKCLLLETQQD